MPFWTPRPWPEGSYELGSVHPSVRKFSWDWLNSFSETQHDVRGPRGVVRVRAGFLGKAIFLPPKWGKNRVF